MTKQQLQQYVEINHHMMTVQEMAAETKESHAKINYLCVKMGYTPITIGERILEFITSHPHLSFKEQCKRLDLSRESLLDHYRKTGTPLPEKIEKEKSVPELIKEYIPVQDRNKEVDRKAFTVYNQSGSDLLDQTRGIKTTERNNKLI